MLDIQLHVLSVSVLFGGRPQVWMKFSRRRTARVEGTGDAQAIQCLFINLRGADRSWGKLSCSTLAEYSYWVCDIASIENCCRILTD